MQWYFTVKSFFEVNKPLLRPHIILSLQLFSEVFVEDPIFVCEVAQSLVNQASNSMKGGRKSVKEKQKILAETWSKLLEVRKTEPVRLQKFTMLET